MTSPFRDENTSLRAENERLRAAGRTGGRSRLLPGLALVAGEFAAAMVLRPWLNAGDDSHFWLAAALLIPMPLMAIWVAARR